MLFIIRKYAIKIILILGSQIGTEQFTQRSNFPPEWPKKFCQELATLTYTMKRQLSKYFKSILVLTWLNRWVFSEDKMWRTVIGYRLPVPDWIRTISGTVSLKKIIFLWKHSNSSNSFTVVLNQQSAFSFGKLFQNTFQKSNNKTGSTLLRHNKSSWKHCQYN
jgi:hypothetical protein